MESNTTDIGRDEESRHVVARRALIVHGSKRGGTEGIAKAIAETLVAEGFTTDCRAAADADGVDGYDVVIIGGGLYAGRWVRDARRYVARNAGPLRNRPVWMFSSGPLDDSATSRDIAPTPSVAALMALVRARGHATFGGRLESTATGFIASRMAKTHAGDWRDLDAIRIWAQRIARDTVANPHVLEAPALPRRWPLAALCAITAITAIGGGLALVLRPDGSYLGAPLSLLDHTPFASFLVPGILLMCAVGIPSLVAATRVMQYNHRAALGAGVMLVGWIVGEMLLLRVINPLQIVYLVIAVQMMMLAVRSSGHPRHVDPAV